MKPKTKQAFVLQGFTPDTLVAYRAIIRPAAEMAGVHTYRADDLNGSGTVIEEIYEAITNCDVLICDISAANPNVMYELGFAHAMRRPTILVSQKQSSMPFDVATVRVIYYDSSIDGARTAIAELSRAIRDALADPSPFVQLPTTRHSVNSVFISYSHHDGTYLERLLVHLKPLEKKGLIELWADTKLLAGSQWKADIQAALARARVAVLLISADFLASDFITDNELPPLLAKAESAGVIILPVIIRPSRFMREPSLSRFHAVNSPAEPLSMMSPDRQESVFDKVSEVVERTIVK